MDRVIANKRAQWKRRSEFLLRPTAASLAVAACFASTVALANPTNPAVVHGAAQISNPAANILNIQTLSPQTIINWGSFSISVGELTRFIQPSALSAVLNRVTGQDPSAILGALQSNGHVFLINPNGIVFGPGAQIDVAGLVASTLNLSNADFLAGRMNFTDGAGAGSVVNQGAINAAGGPVYLVGSAVTNNGLITSPGGEVVLAAGNSVELVNPGTPNLRVEVSAAEHEARNLGSITAEAGRIGIYAGLIKQGGVLNADSAVAEGGRILLKSSKNTTLEAGSLTSARGVSKGGEIVVLSDMLSGSVDASGSMDASASAGDGGFIETSAASVRIGDLTVDTRGGAGGKTGRFLIDPTDFTIGAGTAAQTISGIGADTLSGILGMSDIEIQTSAAGVEDGDIFIDYNVAWSNANTLTLTAHRNITFRHAAGVALDAGSAGSVVLNAVGAVQRSLNATAFTDHEVRALNLTVNAVDGIGVNDGNSFRVSAPGLGTINLNLNNTSSGDIVVTGQSGNAALAANNAAAGGGVYASVNGDLMVSTAATVNASGPVSLNTSGTASTLNVFGNVTSGASIDLGATLAVNVSGGNVISTSANTAHSVSFVSPEMNLSSAGVIRGPNFTLVDTGFGSFTVGSSAGDTISPTSLAKLEINPGSLTDGRVTIASADVHFAEAVTFDPLKVKTLHISGMGGGMVTQAASAPIGVMNLRIDGGDGDPEVDLGAANMVDLISARAGNSFHFHNGKSLTIGTIGDPMAFGNSTGIRVDGNGAVVDISVSGGGVSILEQVIAQGFSDPASVTIEASGSLAASGNANIKANAGYAGTAGVTLTTTGAGSPITLNNAIIEADGGEGMAGGVTINSAGAISLTNTIVKGDGGSGTDGGSGSVNLQAAGAVLIQGGTSLVQAGGGTGSNLGGSASVIVAANGGTLDILSGAALKAFGGDGDNTTGGHAQINLNSSAAMNITGGSLLEAISGPTMYGTGGNAGIDLNAAGNISLDASLITMGNNSGSSLIDIASTGGAIIQVNNTGFLRAEGGVSMSNDPVINLNAQNGIGTLGSPLRISLAGDPDINAVNGAAGDLAIAFHDTGYTGGALNIDGDLLGYVNLNSAGTYLVKVEDGGLNLDIAFEPNNNPLSGSQNVTFEAQGDIVLAGSTGHVNATGGNVVIRSTAGEIALETGSTVSGKGVTLQADNLTIDGTVTSTFNPTVLLTQSAGLAIKLGDACVSDCSALSLSDAELHNVLGGSMVVGTDIGGGSVMFTGTVNPLTTFLNVRGSSIGQTSTGLVKTGINVIAPGGVTLNESGNMIPYFTTGGGAGTGAISLVNSGQVILDNVVTSNANVNVNASGNILLGSSFSAVNAGTGTVTLNSSGAIVDNFNGIDIVAASASLDGLTGIGTLGNPVETRTPVLSLLSEGDVYVVNGGNLLLQGLNAANAGIFASTQFGDASATMQLGGAVTADANLSLDADSGLTVNQAVTAGSVLSLDGSAGSLVIHDTSVMSSGAVLLQGANIAVGSASSTMPTTVIAAGNMAVLTAGQFTVTGGAAANASAVVSANNTVNVLAGGNVTVQGGTGNAASATLFGSPDVNIVLDGNVFITPGSGTGAFAKIEAGSPSTINLLFTTAGKNFFVNNQAGLLYDVPTGTGFLVNGLPAVLGSGFNVAFPGSSGLSGTVEAALPAAQAAASSVLLQAMESSSSDSKSDKSGTDSTDDGKSGTGKSKDPKKTMLLCNA